MPPSNETHSNDNVALCESVVASQVSAAREEEEQAKPRKDHLLLCVAHHPSVTPALMSSLITATALKCREITGQMTKALVPQGSTQRLILTGSPYMPRPGKDLPEWESSWTLGDQVMARLVREIGLELFACGPNQKVRLMTHLLDMERNKEQENLQNEGNVATSSELDSKVDGNKEQHQQQKQANQGMQQKDIAKVCSRVQHWLKLRDAAEQLVQATVIVPCTDKESKDDVKSLVELVFAETWKDGPLQNVQVRVELVTLEQSG